MTQIRSIVRRQILLALEDDYDAGGD